MWKTHLPAHAQLPPGVDVFVYYEVKGVGDQDVGSGLEDLGPEELLQWLPVA